MSKQNSPQLAKQLALLQAAFSKQPNSPISMRLKLLAKLKAKLIMLEQDFITAANKDFNSRTEFDSKLCDFMPTLAGITHIEKHLAKWLKQDKRRVGLQFYPSSAHVEYVPKGVVGVISPWNYPIQLALMPVFTALAAGNRVMLKLSEYTPQTNKVIKHLFAESEAHCVVIEGESDVAEVFSQLPFDHLFFTGSTEVGKHVMASAAKNLTPVTLELGGKSPVVVVDEVDITHAARAILFGKLANAGQICVAPDYVLVEKRHIQALIEEIKRLYTKYFVKGKQPLTSIINKVQFERLTELVSDAQSQGADIWQHAHSVQSGNHQMPLHIITQTQPSMRVRQEEIFGPILPVVEVEGYEQAYDYISQQEKPLAVYLFTNNKEVQAHYQSQLRCGGLVINDILLHVAVEDLPFGGVGHSGMGLYHGKEGVLSLSHAKSIFKSPKATRIRAKLLLSRAPVLNWLMRKLNGL